MIRLRNTIRCFFVAAALIAVVSMTQARAQAPLPGVAYIIPAGFETYPAGTLITYGGYQYCIQDNGTMMFVEPIPKPKFYPNITCPGCIGIQKTNWYEIFRVDRPFSVDEFFRVKSKSYNCFLPLQGMSI
ncbi:hypothetical protein GC170_19615 [bacterium]|nr:hypothetical protein [bacterium]